MAAVAVLVACGPTHYIPLKPQHAAAITSTRVHAIIAQKEVDAAVNQSNTPIPALGLLGAIVGAIVDTAITSHRAGKAEELVEPIRKEISDFDFRTAFLDSLKNTLPALGVLRTPTLTASTAPPTPGLLTVVRAQTRQDTLLSVITRYEFSADFRTFAVLTTAEMSRNGRDEPLYRGTFSYVSDPIPGGGKPADAARAWAFNHAAALRSAMRESIDETMKMLVLDLGATAVVPAQARGASPRAPASPAVAPARPAVALALPTVMATASPAMSPASPTAIAPASSTIAPASPTVIATRSPAVAPEPPTATATASPAIAPASPTTMATASPAIASQSSTTMATVSPAITPESPTATGSPSPTGAARPSPTAKALPSRSAVDSAREIARHADGVMYSTPRVAHAPGSNKR